MALPKRFERPIPDYPQSGDFLLDVSLPSPLLNQMSAREWRRWMLCREQIPPVKPRARLDAIESPGAFEKGQMSRRPPALVGLASPSRRSSARETAIRKSTLKIAICLRGCAPFRTNSHYSICDT